MTFDQYLDKVTKHFFLGGVTWHQSYLAVLETELPEAVKALRASGDIPISNNAEAFAGFIYEVRTALRKEAAVKKAERPTEGWGEIRPGDRKAHYYRDHMALCRKVGFYREHLEPDDEGSSPADCAACRKILDKEKAKQPAESVTA